MSNVLKYMSIITNIKYKVPSRQFVVFLTFAVLLLFKIYWFDWKITTFSGMLEYGLFQFLGYFLFRICEVAIISSSVFLFKKNWWTIVFALITDLWILSNLIYYRASCYFLNVEAIMMADNMDGFWSSIWLYIKWYEFLPIVLSIVYAVFLYRLNKSKYLSERSSYKDTVAIILCAIFLALCANVYYNRGRIRENIMRSEKKSIEHYRPGYDFFYDAYLAAYIYYTQGRKNEWQNRYIKEFSILAYFPACIDNYCYTMYYERLNKDIKQQVQLSPEYSKILDTIVVPSDTCSKPNSNLIVFLFESLESWLYEDWTMSENVSPNLRKLIKDEHVLYASKVISQTKQGNSGDGQMTTVTGLLPLQVGAACRLFGTNTYPSYTRLYDYSKLLNPCPNAWNQTQVTPHYGFRNLSEYEGDDAVVVDSLIANINRTNEQFCFLTLSSASHTPFHVKKEYKHVSLPSDMPQSLKDYITCVNYTDECLGRIIDVIKNGDEHMQNTTLVIVGDHTIFKQLMLKDFQGYAQSANISIKDGKNYIPLIIYSPSITHNTVVPEECYQMDIYPTIMDIIGCKDYFWKGLGVSLYDDAALKNRIISEEQANVLSDAILRDNYFMEYIK